MQEKEGHGDSPQPDFSVGRHWGGDVDRGMPAGMSPAHTALSCHQDHCHPDV
jgi:hypothetical protein